jgi:hypothetical protein
MVGGTGGVGLHEQEGDIDWDDTAGDGFWEEPRRRRWIGLLACAESFRILGILIFLFSPPNSPTTGTSSTNNSSDLFALHK